MGRGLNMDWFKYVKNIFILAFILIAWEIASLNINQLFVPEPKKVLFDLRETILNGTLVKATLYSFKRITISTMIASVSSIPVAIGIYNSSIMRGILNPIISALRYIPVTAFYPLLIMWFGIEEKMKIAFLFIAMFVYMMPSVVLCLDEINPDLFDTGKTMGMNKVQLIYRVQIPASLPSVLNSFIMMFGIGWTYIAIAETINAKYGLGYIIQQSSSRGRTDLVFMAIIVIMIISVAFDNISKMIVRKTFRWRYIKKND